MIGTLVRSAVKLRASAKPAAQVIKRYSGNHTWYYRTPPKVDELDVKMANALGTIIWWWILYNCMTEYDHLIGHYIRPDASEWTDEELGIPPDDE